MLVSVVKLLFVMTALVLTVMIVYGKLFVFKKREPQFVSDYCATMAGLLGGYVFFDLALVWLFPSTLQKLIMFAFALTPFLIGLLANYYTEKYYTAVQVLLFVLSTAFVLF